MHSSVPCLFPEFKTLHRLPIYSEFFAHSFTNSFYWLRIHHEKEKFLDRKCKWQKKKRKCNQLTNRSLCPFYRWGNRNWEVLSSATPHLVNSRSSLYSRSPLLLRFAFASTSLPSIPTSFSKQKTILIFFYWVPYNLIQFMNQLWKLAQTPQL